MKQEHCNGLMWSETDKNFVCLGLTPEFFRQTENIWHIMPPRKRTVALNTPVLSIITYDDMFSLRTPHGGHIVEFNERAQRIPDRLKPDEMIVKLQTDRKEEDEEIYSVPTARPVRIRPGATISGNTMSQTATSLNWHQLSSAAQTITNQVPRLPTERENRDILHYLLPIYQNVSARDIGAAISLSLNHYRNNRSINTDYSSEIRVLEEWKNRFGL